MWVRFVICGCGCAAHPHQRPDHPFLHQTRYIHAPPPLVFNILKKSQYCFCKPLFLCTLWVARSMKALYARVAGPCNAWSLIIGRSVYLAWVGDDMIIITLADLIHEGWWYIINHCLSFIYPILTFAANRNTWFLDPPLFKTPILVREGESLYSCMTFANLILNGQKRVKSWPCSMNASLYAWASRTSEHLLLV